MTREEAIRRFENMKKILSVPNSDAERTIEAIDMAISALQTREHYDKALERLFEIYDTIEEALNVKLTEQVTSKLNNPCDSLLTEDSEDSKEQKSKLDHDREWIIGCIKHDGFIKTDRFDKANQIILEALEVVDSVRSRCEVDANLQPTCNQLATDLISRAETIKAIPQTSVDMFENCRNCELLDREQVIDIINKLPSVSAERVIRCKDCKHYEKDVMKPVHPALGGGTVVQDNCRRLLGILPEEEGFCFKAERKEDK